MKTPVKELLAICERGDDSLIYKHLACIEMTPQEADRAIALILGNPRVIKKNYLCGTAMVRGRLA